MSWYGIIIALMIIVISFAIWHYKKYTSNSNEIYFPLNKKIIQNVCNPAEYNDAIKYPYINYLPFLQPSKEFIKFATIKLKSNREESRKTRNLYEIRAFLAQRNLEKFGDIKDKQNCSVSHFTVLSCKKYQVHAYKVAYKGSNTNNGAIIECHGGGYIAYSARIHFSFAEILSKLTGAVVFLLDYKLSPEHILPYAVNELIILYKYLLYDLNIDSHKIAMTGDSAGGAMILLALQSMKHGVHKDNNIAQPSCVWLNSPWTNLANDCASNDRNKDNELMMGYPRLHQMANWCIGNMDGYLNIIKNNDKKNAIYSPMFGRFDGLCAMYFMVGASELLLDHSLVCAKKAYDAGVDVICDVSPYMCHVWPTIVNVYPESFVACSSAAKWILQQFEVNPSKR